jgi:hypothetical protein
VIDPMQNEYEPLELESLAGYRPQAQAADDFESESERNECEDVLESFESTEHANEAWKSLSRRDRLKLIRRARRHARDCRFRHGVRNRESVESHVRYMLRNDPEVSSILTMIAFAIIGELVKWLLVRLWERWMNRREDNGPSLGSVARALSLAATVLMASAAHGAEPAGVFALLSGNRQSNVSETTLRLPQVAGLTIRDRWGWMQPSRFAFDWSWTDRYVQLCRKVGKPYKLLVMTGRDGMSPKWIGGAWHEGAPVPWSPELASHYSAFVRSLAARYGADPLCVGVHITGPTHPSAEMHPAPRLANVRGYSDEKMAQGWAQLIDIYAAAFPGVTCCLSISVQSPADRYVLAVCDYGRLRLGSRFAVQHNALKASTSPTAPHHKLVASLAKQGVYTGFEMACSAVNEPKRFGSRNVNDGLVIGRAAGGKWFDVYPPDLKGVR